MIEVSLPIAKAADELVVRHDAEADFVGDEHRWANAGRKRLLKPRRHDIDLEISEHKIGQPKREAVHQDRAGARCGSLSTAPGPTLPEQ